MSEEPPSDYEAADLDERRTYHVVISGDGVMMPIERYVELPAHMAELFIEARREEVPTGTQLGWLAELTNYLNEQFPGIADSDFTSDNVTVEPVSDAE